MKRYQIPKTLDAAIVRASISGGWTVESDVGEMIGRGLSQCKGSTKRILKYEIDGNSGGLVASFSRMPMIYRRVKIAWAGWRPQIIIEDMHAPIEFGRLPLNESEEFYLKNILAHIDRTRTIP
ncbi:MAG: hypothetical protein AB1725_06705 [Armatimonadota bacterium]